jgi:hypothetical protein
MDQPVVTGAAGAGGGPTVGSQVCVHGGDEPGRWIGTGKSGADGEEGR